jgi:capsular polysaccharide transport system permease protein
VNVGRGFVVQSQVVHALILRETRTRFGAHQLGFLWAFIEPVLFISTFVVLFSVSERSAPAGMTLFGFMVTGVIPYFLFREASSRVSVAISANKGLLFYPQVRPLDLVVTRTLLEFSTYFLVLCILMGGEALVTGQAELEDPLGVIVGLSLAGGLGAAFGTILGALSLYFPAMERLSGAILRPLFWLSGVFFTANDVPLALLDYIKWNPVLHCVEQVRDGFFYSYESHNLDIVYPFAWVLGLSLFALLFERAARTRIQLT